MNKTEVAECLSAIEDEVKELRKVIEDMTTCSHSTLEFDPTNLYILEMIDRNSHVTTDVYILLSIWADKDFRERIVYAWFTLLSSAPYDHWSSYSSGQEAIDRVLTEEEGRAQVTKFSDRAEGMAYFYNRYMEVHT